MCKHQEVGRYSYEIVSVIINTTGSNHIETATLTFSKFSFLLSYSSTFVRVNDIDVGPRRNRLTFRDFVELCVKML